MSAVAERETTYLLTDERARNQAQNEAEFRAGRVRLASRPLALFVELTQNCNLHCPMCRSGQRYDAQYNLSLDLFDDFAAELFPFAHVVDLRGWGESTMLPWFADVIDVALQYRPQLRLVTNGQVNRSRVWEKLMRAHAMIVVSCDAASPELFSRLRGGGRLSRLQDTVHELVELRDRYGVPARNVELLTVVSRENLHELAAIVELASSLGVQRVTFNPLQTELTDCSHLHHDVRGTEQAYAAAERRARELGVLVQLGAAPDPGLVVPGAAKTHPCLHPWSHAYLDYAGRVGFCDHLIGNVRYTFGCLSEKSFEEIWNGPEWRSLRGEHNDGEISERFYPCRWCFKNRYVEFEDELHDEYRSRVVSTETVEHLVERSDGRQEPYISFV